VDLTTKLRSDATLESIKVAVKAAADGPMKDVLLYVDYVVVSSDVGSKETCIFDVKACTQPSPRFVKLFAWYDNELGYSSKLCDLISRTGGK